MSWDLPIPDPGGTGAQETPPATETPEEAFAATPEPEAPTQRPTVRELPPKLQGLPPEAFGELEAFANTWNGNEHALNAFAKKFHLKWDLDPGHGQTKALVRDLAAGFQQQPNQQPNTQPAPTLPNRNRNASLNLGNIQESGYYVVTADVARALRLDSTIVLGADLRLALLDNAGTLSPEVRASLRVSIGQLGENVPVGDTTGGGLFGGLDRVIAGATNQGGGNLGQPVGYVDGQPVYRNAEGQLVDAAGNRVRTNALGQPVDTNGNPVTVSPSPSTGNANAGAQSSFAAPSADNPYGLDLNSLVGQTPKPGGEPSSGPIPVPGETTPAPPGPVGTESGGIPQGAPAPGGSTPTPGTPNPGGQIPAPGSPTGPTVPPPPIPQGTTGTSTQSGPIAYDPSASGQAGSYGGGISDLANAMVTFVLEVLGIEISRGQARHVLAGMSPELVAGFAADPLGTLTRSSRLLSQLFALANRGHGRDRGEALLQLFDIFNAKNPSAQEVYNFFTSLQRDDIAHLIAHRAEAIGNLTGVPPEVRMAANAQRIEATLMDLRGARDPAAQRRAQTLERLLADNAQILYFDNAPDGRLAAGRISQVFGSLAEAKYVGLMIPGLNNTMDTFSARAQRGELMHQLAQPMVRDGMAMVVWLERLGQEVLRQYRSMLTAWQAREQSQTPMTFQQALAQAARQLAQETLPGMMLRGDARLTFVGHSFGSLIAKESLNQGAKPDACVFLGMPEHRLKKIAAQAGCGDVDLYSMVAEGDTVDEAAVADEAPAEPEAAGPEDELDRLDPGKDLVPPIEAVLDPHDNYGLDGSATLAQIVSVTLGWRPKLLPPEPSVITLFRSADGTYEDQAEPVGWFSQGGEEW